MAKGHGRSYLGVSDGEGTQSLGRNAAEFIECLFGIPNEKEIGIASRDHQIQNQKLNLGCVLEFVYEDPGVLGR
jgi:hypothetical protein